MADVLIALLPACAVFVYSLGASAVLSIAVCVGCAVASELLFNLIVKKNQTVTDCSAIVIGLLLALSLRGSAPLWQCVCGAVLAIVVAKCLFGGYGKNIVNPAAAAYAFMLLAFPLTQQAYTDVKISIANAVALALGFVYLIVRGRMDWFSPLVLVSVASLFTFVFSGDMGLTVQHMLGGNLLLCAVFMAADTGSVPKSKIGRALFCLGCGVITSLFNMGYIGSYTDGAVISILMMNLLSPLIDNLTLRGARNE